MLTKVLHVESVILKNTEHDHLFLPWFAWVVSFFIYLSLPFLSPFLFIWMNWQDNTVLIENCSLDNTKHVSELYYQLVNFQEKLKTMVLIVPMRCLKEKPWSQ